MAGTTDIHAQIVANLVAIVRPVLRGTACRGYANDIKVVTPYPSVRYPDFIVTCDERDAQDRLIKAHPKLIVEVLSPSTANTDLGDKLDEYQTINELQEYVLIDSRKRSVRIFRRNGEKLETGLPLLTGSVQFQSLRLTSALDDLYEDVDFGVVSERAAIE